MGNHERGATDHQPAQRVEQDPPLMRVIETRKQADERRLAGTGWTNNRNDLARLGFEADLLQRINTAGVAEADALEPHVTRGAIDGECAWHILDSRLCVH